MGKILQEFTITRNILGKNTEVSASRLRDYIERVGEGMDSDTYKELSKGERNDISSFASYTGLFEQRPDGGYYPTDLNLYYKKLQDANLTNAWQWLITRSLWHFVLPNGTSSPLNGTVRELNIKFYFFKNILGLLYMLSALPGDDRFLYFHEFCILFDEDRNWSESPMTIFNKLMEVRKNGVVNRNRHFIDDLETEYHVGRDNLSTVFVKALSQTGVFIYKDNSAGTKSGIAMSTKLTEILQRRIRHILDTELVHADPEKRWPMFIASHGNDLPLEVDKDSDLLEVKDISPTGMSSICDDLFKSLSDAGLVCTRALLKRFACSLLSKPFLIITGLSGSGKTKLAHAFAAWITPKKSYIDPFLPGNQIESERIIYYINNSDSIAVEFSNNKDFESATLVTLPKAIIEEWASYIYDNSLSREVSARQIREGVSSSSKFSSQLHSFETHLKAAAFALIDSRKTQLEVDCYRIIPVGADWTSNENVLGYPDALHENRYSRPISGALDLILQARNDKERPYFLILDEMNLSHVERYFADVLSAIESEKEISLHASPVPINGGKGQLPVPDKIRLPNNLFIIGTVNIDETTYMFSPKVLDRANVIEFRAAKEDIEKFLKSPIHVSMEKLAGQGIGYAANFVRMAAHENAYPSNIPTEIADAEAIAKELTKRLTEVFEKLSPIGAEFGFRTAIEISRFIYYHAVLSGPGWNFNDAFDAQIA
jgi:energy-coupling factor transporter ATP-binding protein EcfA2